jgi:ankyrin repeat protein
VHAEGARKLQKSGKRVDEVLAAVKDRKHAGRGPLHMAAWAGRLEMCKFLIKDLRIDANTVGNDGTS